MPQTTVERPGGLLATTTGTYGSGTTGQSQASDAERSKGFGSGASCRNRKRKSGGKRSPGLSKADWGPLGKHPDRDAIVARQRLHLPLAGRLSELQVNQAWKRCASEHHPDRGGAHNTMQLVNGARDLLLGRLIG